VAEDNLAFIGADHTQVLGIDSSSSASSNYYLREVASGASGC